MELFYDQTMTANALVVDLDNVSAVECRDMLTVLISRHFETRVLRTGDWVLVRNPDMCQRPSIVRRYWPNDDGVLLARVIQSIPAHSVPFQCVDCGVVLKIRKASTH